MRKKSCIARIIREELNKKEFFGVLTDSINTFREKQTLPCMKSSVSIIYFFKDTLSSRL